MAMVIRSVVPRFSMAFAPLVILLLAGACGGKQIEPKKPGYEIDDEKESDSGMTMMQEFGGMNEEKVQKTIERIFPELSSCLMDGYQRVEFLGGEVAFLVKVNMKGEAEAAHAERSTLGDFQAEQCMLDKIRVTKWPKPVGGKIGLARTSIAFDPPSDVRAPVAWEESDIQTFLASSRDELRSCGRGGPFKITVYVGTRGNVLSAGVAHADDHADSTAACLVGAVQNLNFPSPGSWPAKVSFDYR